MSPSEPIHWASARGRPVKPMASDRKAAPDRMSAIIAEVRVAPIRLSMKVCQRERALRCGKDQRADDAESGRLGRRGEAQIHRADDEQR